MFSVYTPDPCLRYLSVIDPKPKTCICICKFVALTTPHEACATNYASNMRMHLHANERIDLLAGFRMDLWSQKCLGSLP